MLDVAPTVVKNTKNRDKKEETVLLDLNSQPGYRTVAISESHIVGMGDGLVATAPDILIARGLGSCVALMLWDAHFKIGAMAHIMLPDSREIIDQRSPFQCADTAIKVLLREIIGIEGRRENIVAKIVGGANMFAKDDPCEISIGEANIDSIKQLLKSERILLLSEDTGGSHGRSVEFYPDCGKVMVTTVGYGSKNI